MNLIENGHEFNYINRIKILLGIAEALDFLHIFDPHTPCLHRDIKSSNVLLMDDFTPLLIDCGLSKYHHQIPESSKSNEFNLTMSSHIVIKGTRGYISPEVMAGNEYDIYSEIYSFGVVIAEVFSGKVQGHYKDNVDNRIKILASEITGIQVDERGGVWPKECEDELRRLALQCLSSERSSLIGSMQQIRLKLEKLLNY